jgi:hypothetical protein
MSFLQCFYVAYGLLLSRTRAVYDTFFGFASKKTCTEMKESEVCGMFQKLAAIERGILDKRFRRRCVKAGHCAECKKQKMHYCCKCDAEIKNDCPGYLSHIDEKQKHLIRQLVQE